MLLVSKSDTGSDFANFLYRSSFPCRAHSASCRGCASVNKMENFARRPVHHILSIFSHQDKPQLSHFQFLDAAQTGTRAQRQPGDENKQVTDTDRDPRPETTRRREEQTRLVFQRQLRPLSVVYTKFSYKSIFGGTAIRRIYKFSDVGETSAEPESTTILRKTICKPPSKVANSVRKC